MLRTYLGLAAVLIGYSVMLVGLCQMFHQLPDKRDE